MPISQAEQIARRAKPRAGWTDLKRDFRCSIAEERRRLGLTLRTVSKHSGVTSSGLLSRIEHGANVQLDTAFHLARFFGKTIEELWQPLDGTK